MFPGLQLTNDDEGVNVRPLPILEAGEERGFYTPHTYHLDIRFETGFTQPHILADAIMNAISLGRRVVVEHFDLIYPLLPRNADLMIGVGEQISHRQADDVRAGAVRIQRDRVQIAAVPPDGAYGGGSVRNAHGSGSGDSCRHDDIHHGFILDFQDRLPQIDLFDLAMRVNADIAANLPVEYSDETHISVGGHRHECSGPRTHVSSTGRFAASACTMRSCTNLQQNRYLMIGFVGDESDAGIAKLENRREYRSAFII